MPRSVVSTNFGGIFDVARRTERIRVLEEEMASQGFWDRRGEARSVIEEANRLNAWVGSWNKLFSQAEELRELGELLAEDDDEELGTE